jgi:Bacterial SH3 domain
MLKSIAVAAGLTFAIAGTALASAFWPGTVINIPSWDVLNVRAWPSSTSRIIDVYDKGDRVSLTGRCKNTSTGISFRIDAGGSAKWKYSRMAASYVWCQVMSPSVQIGWVRGKYVWPE